MRPRPNVLRQNDNFNVVRLDKKNHNSMTKMASTAGNFGYILSDDVSCYVVDESQYFALQRRNMNDYLENGGAIIVNGKGMSIDSIVAKVDVPNGQLSFLDPAETYGTFLYKTKYGIEINSYTVGFVKDDEKMLEISPEVEKAYVEKAESKLKTDDIIEWIIDIIHRLLKEFGDTKDDNRDESVEEKVRKEITLGSASCYNLPFGLFSGKKMCSYKILTEVKQGQKFLDENSKRRGIYDITSKYIIGAETGYRVRKYQPVISSIEEIMDATYIHSDVKEEYNFGGSLGFDGKEVGAKVEFNYGYQVESTGQDVSNSFDFSNNICKWAARPTKQSNYGESYVLTPGVRIISEDDTATIHADLGMGDFIISKLIVPYYMVDSTRKTLPLRWKADEEISKTETVGY